MFISPIKATYPKYQHYNNRNVSNPIQKPNNISFCGHLSNSELLSAGYKPVSIEADKILGREDKILIDSSQKFLALLNSPDVWNKNIVLTGDIDLNGTQIKPIGNNAKPFKGEFNGNGYKISNFRIVAPNAQNVGLFGKVENAKLTGIEISDAYISGKQQVGGLAGYAINSEIKDCSFDGYIEGEKKLGGLLGLSKQTIIQGINTNGTVKSKSQTENSLFGGDSRAFSSSGIVGGLIGTDEASIIDNSYSSVTLISKEQTGGILGYAEGTQIKNVCYSGQISCENKAGGIVGWASDVTVSDSYALSNKENSIGEAVNSSLSRTYSDLDALVSKAASSWSSNIWNLAQERLPRLKFQEEKMSAESVFLEDVNIGIKTKRINKNNNFDTIARAEVKFDLTPPKHYSENDELLKEIENCRDADSLHEMFGILALNAGYMKNKKNDDSKYDELLLALVQNPKMNLNRHFNSDYNIWCTPLFVLTCLNKPYILQQALKRDDVDVTVGSGFRHNLTVLNQAIKHHIDPCAYVLLTSPKMQEQISQNIEILKASKPSAFTKLLLELYPDIPKYNNEKGCVEFTKEFEIPQELLEPLAEVSDLLDVQRTVDIDKNYKDSRGNNIINVAATLEDEPKALAIFLAAQKIGTDIDNWNKKGESPVGHALYLKKHHLLAQILKNTKNPFVRIDDGTDSMLLFSNLPEEKYAVNYMEIARKRGLSVNSQDKDGNTPLINAVRLRHYDKIKYLLSNGANPNLYDSAKQTPLHHACINNDQQAIEMLLESYAYPNIKDDLDNLPLDYLDEEIKSQLSPKFEDKAYLYQLSGFANDYECSHSASNLDEYSQITTSQQLSNITNQVISGDNCDKQILQLTKNAALNPNVKLLKDDEGNNLLHIAASAKSFFSKECIKAALDAGIDIDTLNNNKETPLMSALNAYLCTTDSEEKAILMQNIKLLLDNDPNVDLIDGNKQSALHRICQSGNLILLNEILKLNPKINQVDVLGKTPFEYMPFEADTPMYMTFEQYLKNYKILKEKK